MKAELFKNPLIKRSYGLSRDVCILCFRIQKENREFDITRQLIRSISSVTANLFESRGAVSAKDFFHKYSICYKELMESYYWINLISDIKLVDSQSILSILKEVEELSRIFSKSKITLKRNLKLNS